MLPLNITRPMPRTLEVMRWTVEDEIARYLRQHGSELRSVPRNVARSQWLSSLQRAREGDVDERTASDRAAGALAGSLRELGEFDAMVVPSLVKREAAIEQHHARWDGARQRIQVETRGLDARRLSKTPLDGVVPAASLHIMVFDAQGQKLHEAFGGLEVLVRVRATGQNLRGEPTFRLLPRTDLLVGLESVREGVAIAFMPFLAVPAPVLLGAPDD